MTGCGTKPEKPGDAVQFCLRTNTADLPAASPHALRFHQQVCEDVVASQAALAFGLQLIENTRVETHAAATFRLTSRNRTMLANCSLVRRGMPSKLMREVD